MDYCAIQNKFQNHVNSVPDESDQLRKSLQCCQTAAEQEPRPQFFTEQQLFSNNSFSVFFTQQQHVLPLRPLSQQSSCISPAKNKHKPTFTEALLLIHSTSNPPAEVGRAESGKDATFLHMQGDSCPFTAKKSRFPIITLFSP